MKTPLTIPQLRKKLWRLFSEYIRLRDANEYFNGVWFGTCISCNNKILYPNTHGRWQAGHYLPRSMQYMAVYFNEINVNGQCRKCNRYLEGSKSEYRKGLIKKYGKNTISTLENDWGRNPVLSKDWNKRETYITKIGYYKTMIKHIKKERE